MRLIVLILLLFALPAWADTLTVSVNRDNGVTNTTEPLTLNAPNIGAAPSVAGVDFYSAADDQHAAIEIDQTIHTSTDDRQGAIHATTTGPDTHTGAAANWLEFISTGSLTGGFDSALTTILRNDNINGGTGDAQWWVAATPNTNTGNWVVNGGEINTFNAYADMGYQEDVYTAAKPTSGLFMVPESELNVGRGVGRSLLACVSTGNPYACCTGPQAGTCTDERGYNSTYGIMFGRSSGRDYGDLSRDYPSSKWWIPLYVGTDATAPTGTSVLLRGGTTAPNAPAAAIKLKDYQTVGIDATTATFSGPAIKLANSQTIGDVAGNTVTVAQMRDATKIQGAAVTGVSGNGGKVATTTGTLTTDHCVKLDANGNFVDAGSACGSAQQGSGISALTGDVTASGTGSVSATVISASTSQAGKVQLTDSTSSTSTTTAATPNSVKTAYDLANAAIPKSGGTATGNIVVQRSDASPQIEAFSQKDTYQPPQLLFTKRNASNSITPSGDTIGDIRWQGIDAGGSFDLFAKIHSEIGTNATGGAPASIIFSTAETAVQATEKARLTGNGNLLVGIATDSNDVRGHFATKDGTGGVAVRLDEAVASSTAPTLLFRSMRGTYAAPKRRLLDDGLVGFALQGAYAADDTTTATQDTSTRQFMFANASENWTSTGRGWYWGVKTRATGTTGAPTERFRISDGGMQTEGLDDKTASFTVVNSTSRITLGSGTAVATLKKDLPAGTTSVLVTVAGAAASGVSFAAESGGSLSWGDAGSPSFTNNKTADVVCVSENAAATSTAAWRCVKGGNF